MSAQAFEIPLSPQAQTIQIGLSGVTYGLTFRWCGPANCWMMTIADASGNNLVSGIPLITGADLLAQYKYLGIGGSLICQTDADVLEPPAFGNLGVTGHLYYITA